MYKKNSIDKNKNMKPLIIISIIITLSILILLIRIRFIIYINKENKINVDVFIIPKLNIKIDLDKLIRKYIVKNNKLDLKSLITNTTLFFENKKVVKDLLKKCVVRKIKLLIHYDYLKYDDIYLNVANWYFLSNIKNKIDSILKKVKSEEYNIIYTGKFKTDFIIDGMISVYSIIMVGIKNIKYIIGGIKKYGTSNK